MGAEWRPGRGPVVRHGFSGFRHVGLAGGVRSGSWPLTPEERGLEIRRSMLPTDEAPPHPIGSGRRFPLNPSTAS